MLLNLPFSRWLALLGLCLMGLPGCEENPNGPMTPPHADAGDGSAMVISRTLAVVGADTLTLEATEIADISFRYSELDGLPVRDAEIALALIGRADDSSLLERSIVTDGTGQAYGRIIGGNRPATFRIRASAESALPVYIDVSVSPTGFGSLIITPEHTGDREIADFRVALFSGVGCADGDPLTRSPERERVVAPDENAEFVGLPADTIIAIAAWGRSAMGHPVAYGCADGFMVSDAGITMGRISLSDLSLALDGRYELAIQVTSAAASERAASATTAATSSLATSRGSDADFLLDSLHRSLVVASDLGAAGILEVLIDSGDAEIELSRMLARDGVGASVAIGEVATTIGEMLGTFTIEGTLVFPVSTEDSATWMSQTVTVNSASGGAPFSLPVADITADPSGSMQAEVNAVDDRIIVHEHALRLPLSGLAFQAFTAEIASGPMTPEGEARFPTQLGCGTLMAWIESRPSLATTCEASCVDRACRQATADTLGAITSALGSLDDLRSVISLSGEFAATNPDGDLHPDTLSSDALDGVWTAPGRTEGDSVHATAMGDRAVGF